MTSKLFLLATPLGNLNDLSERAKTTLRDALFVACEDTRVTRKLISHVGSNARLFSVREENEIIGSKRILEHLAQDEDVVYCTDAGTPCISDPGSRVVDAVVEAGYQVVPIPGPSAGITALAVSGIRSDQHLFAGFSPPKKSARIKFLTEFKDLPWALVFFEAPHRMNKFLVDAHQVYGDRKICICRELSKMYEEIIHSTLAKCADDLTDKKWRGELSIVIAGADSPTFSKSNVLEDMKEWLEIEILEKGNSVKSAALEAAAIFGVKKNDSYKAALEIKESRK